MGSQTGLTKYDGHAFQHFVAGPADIRGLADAVAEAWSVAIYRKPARFVVIAVQVSSQADDPYGAVYRRDDRKWANVSVSRS